MIAVAWLMIMRLLLEAAHRSSPLSFWMLCHSLSSKSTTLVSLVEGRLSTIVRSEPDLGSRTLRTRSPSPVVEYPAKVLIAISQPNNRGVTSRDLRTLFFWIGMLPPCSILE